VQLPSKDSMESRSSIVLFRPSITQKSIVLGCCLAVFFQRPATGESQANLGEATLEDFGNLQVCSASAIPNTSDGNLSVTIVNANEIQKLGYLL
jgi:hypothetical protein